MLASRESASRHSAILFSSSLYETLCVYIPTSLSKPYVRLCKRRIECNSPYNLKLMFCIHFICSHIFPLALFPFRYGSIVWRCRWHIKTTRRKMWYQQANNTTTKKTYTNLQSYGSHLRTANIYKYTERKRQNLSSWPKIMLFEMNASGRKVIVVNEPWGSSGNCGVRRMRKITECMTRSAKVQFSTNPSNLRAINYFACESWPFDHVSRRTPKCEWRLWKSKNQTNYTYT